MHPQALLAAATALVDRVLRFERPSEQVVAEFCRETPALGSRDRRLLADTAFELLRRLLFYRELAATAPPGPSTREAHARRLAALAWQGDVDRLGVALDPAEARWRADALAIDPSTLAASSRHNLPEWIATPIESRLGAAFAEWADRTNAPAPLDLRVNVAKADRRSVLEALAGEGVVAASTPYSPIGIRVEGKPTLTSLEVYTSGRVEPQDEGSQLLALAVGARRGETVVDFCAGAGGKTLALGAQMRSTGRLYALDVSGHRLAAMRERLERSGLANVHPMQIAHERDDRLRRLAGKVDRVLVDAPCSGLGTLRRHPDLKWRHGAATLDELVPLQRRVLAAAADLVKPGGRLVYATCSPLDAEDEAVADAFDESHGTAFARLPLEPELRRARVEHAATLVERGCLRLWSHLHGTDGFFAAAWQRR